MTAPSAPHRTTRRAVTASGIAGGVSDSISSTATMTGTMQADSHGRWNRAVQISGIRMTMPTPDVVPAASTRARTEPV
jgi:hypothetical protein